MEAGHGSVTRKVGKVVVELKLEMTTSDGQKNYCATKSPFRLYIYIHIHSGK